MEPFIVGIDINDIDQLYGRSREIETLISCAKRKGNAGIIGARRFGKTCLMKSLESYLSSNENSEAYPLYFDVKTQCGIKKNTTAVFRAMASLLASKMCLDSLLPEGVLKVSRRCSLEVSCDELDMRVQMEEWNPEYQKQTLFTLAKLLSDKKKYLLLLLDEIDYLLLEAFENPSDFSRLRGAATDKDANLKFWVAGTSSWSGICTSVGSPELNCGLENVTLTSLLKEDFSLLWNKECSLIEDNNLKTQFLALSDLMYAKTGGVPYYAKFVASHMYTNKTYKLPEYDIIRDYLCEIVNNRFVSKQEKSSLYVLAKQSKMYIDTVPDGVTSLKTKGLVSVSSDSSYHLPIGYLSDYLNACDLDNEVIDEENIEQKEIDILVDQIIQLRINVNKTCDNNDKIFPPSDEDPGEFDVLRIKCTSKPSLDSFANSVCKLYYEGSNKGQMLPNGFIRRDFSNLVRALRNLGDHRECIPTSMSEERLYNLVNNGLRPFLIDHYKNIQLTVLNMFTRELMSMLASSHSNANNIPVRNTIIPRPILVSDNEYEGKIVLVGSFKKVECDIYPYPLKIEGGSDSDVYEDEIVIFTAKSRPNDRDANKTFWYATNVRLKED